MISFLAMYAQLRNLGPHCAHTCMYVKEDALSMRFSLKRVAAASVASHVLVARRPSAIV